MAMEGRCDVQTWAEFGFSGISCTPKVKFSGDPDVFLIIGCDEVYVFSTKDKKLTASNPYTVIDHVSKLQCNGPH